MGTIPYYVVIILLLTHWFADFVLQTDDQAKGKSKSMQCLLEHTVTYSAFLLLPITTIFFYECGDIILSVFLGILFTLITFLCHTYTDYFTSRINSELWKNNMVHEFFVSVGADQVLHYLQLLLTFKLLLELINI